jgi:hypothetical protein
METSVSIVLPNGRGSLAILVSFVENVSPVALVHCLEEVKDNGEVCVVVTKV